MSKLMSLGTLFKVMVFLSIQLQLGLGLANASQDKPNILFISVDDWNDWAGALGHPAVHTPNIDRLAREGVNFTNAHTPSTFCTPARTAVMTGLLPSTTGCYRNEIYFFEDPSIVDLAQHFKGHGYRMHGGGKLYHHMPGYVDMRGWDEFFVWNPKHRKSGFGTLNWGKDAPQPAIRPNSPVTQEMYQHWKKDKPADVEPLQHMDYAALDANQEADMADTIVTQWAVDFLNEKQSEPFFLGVGLYAPHKPNFVPKRYFDLYPLDEIQPPPIQRNDKNDLPPSVVKTLKKRTNHEHKKIMKHDVFKETIQGYLAAVSYADAMVGRVLDALRESPYHDNTIVVFWSDNGYHNGEKDIWAKHTLWDRTSHVPFIWAGPGIAKGEEVNEPTSLVDIYPTLADLCDLPSKGNWDGLSLSAYLKGEERGSVTERPVLQVDVEGTAVIANEWRYIQYNNGEQELYNTRRDPHEWDNLAEIPEYADEIKWLASFIPKERALGGRQPHQLRLVFEGEHFYWKPKSKTKTAAKNL